MRNVFAIWSSRAQTFRIPMRGYETETEAYPWLMSLVPNPHEGL